LFRGIVTEGVRTEKTRKTTWDCLWKFHPRRGAYLNSSNVRKERGRRKTRCCLAKEHGEVKGGELTDLGYLGRWGGNLP